MTDNKKLKRGDMQQLIVRILTILALAMPAVPAAAQNLFRPVAEVNERVVTAWELDQRTRMLELFGNPADPRAEALEALIDERLQLQEADRLGITATEEEIVAGEEEFAQRAELSREEFIQRLGQAGVAAETFRDFVRAGVLWRMVVRETLAPQSNVAPADVQQSLTEARGPQTTVRALLSEIIMPADTPRRAAMAQQIADEVSGISTFDGFAAAARQYSASQSRERSGRIDWLPLSNLPPQLAQQLLTLEPGDVTQPIQLPNALAIFQLRALEETNTAIPRAEALDYAVYLIPGGRSAEALEQAARLRAEVQTCDDLYEVARTRPEGALARETRALSEIPADVALELARLDAGEISTRLTTPDGQALRFAMLCERIFDADAEITAEQVQRGLLNQQTAGRSEARMAELRANAHIVTE